MDTGFFHTKPRAMNSSLLRLRLVPSLDVEHYGYSLPLCRAAHAPRSQSLDGIRANYGLLRQVCSRAFRAGQSLFDFCLGFAHSESRIVFRIVLVIGTVISDAANHFIGVVTASEGTLGEGPVPFRLGYLAFGSDATPSVCDEVFSAFVV